MAGTETRDIIRSWSMWAVVATLVLMTVLHLQIAKLLPDGVENFYLLREKIFPMSWKLRYLFRGLFIFAAAYGSMAHSIVFRKENPNGIYYFGVAAVMLMYGYIPSLEWYNMFIFPLTPFVVLLNAKHLPVLNFNIKTRDGFYNNYNRVRKEGDIHFPLERKRLKSVVDKPADFSHDFVIQEPSETLILEAGTGKGKSRGCLSHYIDSCVENGWNIIIHDFKGDPHNAEHPELTKFAMDSVNRKKKNYDLNVIGFTDPSFTKRCNIYDPMVVKTEQHVMGVNESLMFSLNKSWAKASANADPFWKDNTIALINGIQLTTRKYRPDLLTAPHLVALAVRDTEEVMDAFLNVPDPDIKIRFQAFKNSYDLAKETAGGIISSTQIPLMALNDEMMFWALSGNKSMGDDFFELNFDNDLPFILSVCNNADIPIHTHGVNTYLKQILTRLSSGSNRPTALVLDEFDQIYLDGIDRAIATVRSVGTKIVIVLQGYEQLVDKMGKPYADKIMTLGQNRVMGGGASPAQAKSFVGSYVPKYQDLEGSVSQSGANEDSSTVKSQDKKVVESPEILGQEKFHFTGVVSTGDPNTFFNLPFKINKLDLKSLELPFMNQNLKEKHEQFSSMVKVGSDGLDTTVDSEEANSAFDEYKQLMLSENRTRIFKEADEFIDDLKHGLI